MEKFKRVLFKISGESLADSNGIYSHKKLSNLASQLLTIKKQFPGLEIAIVSGGGNIWRGRSTNNLEISNYDSDYIGMLATVMNGITLKNYLEKAGLEVVLFNSFNLTKIANDYKIDKAIKALKKKKIVICAGGTGSPFFTTDTTASLRACELSCEAILMAKSMVDGVYDCDPKKNPQAKFFDKISFQKCLELKLEIMDQTAFTLCMQNFIKILVFNADKENNFINLLNNKIKYTIIE